MWQEQGLDGLMRSRKKVLTRALTHPTLPSYWYFFLCLYFLAKEADWTNFESKFLVRIPKVSEHHIDDWNLIDLGSVNLQYRLSIALPHL